MYENGVKRIDTNHHPSIIYDTELTLGPGEFLTLHQKQIPTMSSNRMGIAYLHLLGALAVTAASAEFPISYIQGSSVFEQLTTVFLVAGLTLALLWMSPGPLKYLVYIAYVTLLGQLIAPMVALLQDAGLLRSVLISVAGIFGGMTLISFAAPARSLSMGPYLFAGLIGLVMAQVIGMVAGVTETVSRATLTSVQRITAWFGTALFAVYVAYDTQRMKRRVSGMESPDYVEASLGVYLDILNLFAEVGSLRS